MKAEESKCRLVIHTPLHDRDLSDDVLALIEKHRLILIKPWESVKTLFKVKNIDNSVIKKTWLADVLLTSVPVSGTMLRQTGFLVRKGLGRRFFLFYWALIIQNPI